LNNIIKYGVIYKIIFPNGKLYIGKTIRLLDVRLKDHIKYAFSTNSTSYNSKLFRAIRKYLKSGIKIKIVERNIRIDKLNKKEIFYIKKYDTYNGGYNSTLGGEGIVGYKHSRRARKIISQRSKLNTAENATSRKTNWETVRKIRKLYLNGASVITISKAFLHLAYPTISDIVKNITWKDARYFVKYTKFKNSNKMSIIKADCIRIEYVDGISADKLAHKYNVSYRCINNIINNKVWIGKTDKKAIEERKYKNIRSTAKLNIVMVRKIRKLCSTKTVTEISKIFDVSVATISSIVNNKIWKD